MKISEQALKLSPFSQFLGTAKLQEHLVSRAKNSLVEKEQLHWASPIPLPTLERALMTLEMERFLDSALPIQKKWQINDYCWSEQLDAASLLNVWTLFDRIWH
jgi:hypothetical protein